MRPRTAFVIYAVIIGCTVLAPLHHRVTIRKREERLEAAQKELMFQKARIAQFQAYVKEHGLPPGMERNTTADEFLKTVHVTERKLPFTGPGI